MDLFEYQGKQFFAKYGIPVSDGAATNNVDEAVATGAETPALPEPTGEIFIGLPATRVFFKRCVNRIGCPHTGV